MLRFLVIPFIMLTHEVRVVLELKTHCAAVILCSADVCSALL